MERASLLSLPALAKVVGSLSTLDSELH
jgi:hypothetical protein